MPPRRLLLALHTVFVVAASGCPAPGPERGAGERPSDCAQAPQPLTASPQCEDRPRTRLTILTSGFCPTDLEGVLERAEPVGNGVRLVVTSGATSCTIEVSDVGSDIASQLPVGLEVVGSVVNLPKVPRSFVYLAKPNGVTCPGEDVPRRPPVFLAVDGLALNTDVGAPALRFDAWAGADRCQPEGCLTERTTGSTCDFCGSRSEGCWSIRHTLQALYATDCSTPAGTEISLDQTVTLPQEPVRARLLWGLFQRECDTSWLPEVGRGAWVVWRTAP